MRDQNGGGAKVQPDLEYSKPLVSFQGQFEDEQKVFSVGKVRLLPATEPADKSRGFSSMDHLESLGGIACVQRSHFQNQPSRRKPSPTVWRLALMIGDGIVLVALLVRITSPAPHLGLNVLDSVFGIWNANLLWLFLALASWGLAVNITQAQQLDCAAGLLKSPLYALCSLALMLIFSMLLLYLFIGAAVISFIEPLSFFLAVAAPILSIWRVLLAEVINLPRFRRQAVIVGVNAAGQSVARELLRAKHPGINVLGYIDESGDGQKQQDGLPTFRGRSALRGLAQNGLIDVIIMAIDFKANPELFQEALAEAQRGISVVPVAAVYESTSGKIPLDHIGDQWSTAFPAEQFVSPLYLCWNRALDLAFGICGLLILCLLLPILAPLIYLDSPGPIFFSQERAGYRGRTFRMLKLRSMSTGAQGGAWVSRGDARVTRVGRILRATHLDELPQVLNIVRGDMSLIGPRPERPGYVVELAKSNLFYTYRLSVRPGLTGWAQVKYGYGASEQDELVKLQYDLYYIKHRSFLLDVCILLKTVGEVVLSHGV
jgi:exopolysaccharide biosynthesis polyprenyl glycosylphosphotransferase